MYKYDINRFYVGVLNFPFPLGNALINSVGGNITTKEEIITHNLYLQTKDNGAIDINHHYGIGNVNKVNGYSYEILFTLFYKEDDGSYYCLHNDKRFREEDLTFCDNLTPLIDVLPKYGCNIPDKISLSLAFKMFNTLFYKKILGSRYFLYNNDKFDINDIYYGYIDLCTGYGNEKTRKEYNLNIPSIIMLSNQHLGLYYDYVEDFYMDDEEWFSIYNGYQTLFLRLDDYNYYSIHNHKVYNVNNSLDPLSDVMHLKEPLIKRQSNIDFPKEITISKLLKKKLL